MARDAYKKMVTKINLSSGEVEKKKTFSGKTALILSGVLLILVGTVYGALVLAKNKYNSDGKQIMDELSAEKAKMGSPEYAGVVDFQERLSLLDQIIDDHIYWEIFLKKLSMYVVSGAYLKNVSGGGEGGEIKVSGAAVDFETVAKELMLLKTFPNASAVKVESVGEGSDSGEEEGEAGSEGEGGRKEVGFEVKLKVSKDAFRKQETD